MPRQLDGLAVALDSAGFVAMQLYGGYRWTPRAYAGLAAELDPLWWASMDFCCEPEITAADAGAIAARQWMTTWHLTLCRHAAREVGAKMPMPVIQGWHRDDYVEHAKEIDRALGGDWPDLVGVGSVYRRSLKGEAGVLAIVDRLDSVLPDHVGLHLFGVKSTALEYLASCPRVASVDSMAWDAAYRRRGNAGGVHERAEFMRDWFHRQQKRATSPRPFQRWLI